MVRYSPMADVRVFSLSSLLDYFTSDRGFTPTTAAMAQAWAKLAESLQNYDHFYHYLVDEIRNNPDIFFRSVGLANDVRLTEDYGTRSVYGIGQPTKPVLVPNNLAVGVSISRFTIDKKAISNYVTKPVYWYESRLQRLALDTMLALNTELLGGDYFFYTFLVLHDIETGGLPSDLVEALDNYGIVAFMPRSYNTPITNGTAIITHSVTGEGKFLRLPEIIDEIANTIASLVGG